MRKLSYRAGLPGYARPIKSRPTDLEDNAESHTEYGSRGFAEGTRTDSTSPFDAKDPEMYEEVAHESREGAIDDELMDIFVELGDAMDHQGEEVLANFVDFMIKKYADAKKSNYTVLFNDLLIKINNADLTNTNDILKKLTKIYSRTLKLEFIKNKNLEKSKESAYKKVLHRADQYLSSE